MGGLLQTGFLGAIFVVNVGQLASQVPSMPFPDCPRTLSMAMRVSTHLQTKFLTERSLLEFQLPKELRHLTLTNQNKNTTLITHTKSATSKFLSSFNRVRIWDARIIYTS